MATVEEIRADGGKAVAVKGDNSLPDSANAVAAESGRKLSPFDGDGYPRRPNSDRNRSIFFS